MLKIFHDLPKPDKGEFKFDKKENYLRYYKNNSLKLSEATKEINTNIDQEMKAIFKNLKTKNRKTLLLPLKFLLMVFLEPTMNSW